jgi:hypothetical protein
MEDAQKRGMPQAREELISLIPGKRPGAYTVRLNLPFRPVFVGTLEGDTFSKRIDPSKHVHHSSDSVAISAALLFSGAIPFKWIVIDTPEGKLVTSRRFFVSHGRPYTFRGYEPQLFLPRSEFGIDAARRWEEAEDRRERARQELATQMQLFAEAAA